MNLICKTRSINKNHCQTVINTFLMRGTQLKYTDSAAMYETEALVTYGKT